MIRIVSASAKNISRAQEGVYVAPAGKPEPARITAIDIDRVARTLAVLRCSDYFLVVACGMAALRALPNLAVQAYSGHGTEAGATLAMAVTLGFAAYTGWRHVGVIDPRVWRSYLWVFPLLTGFAALLALATLPTVTAKGWETLGDVSAFMELGSVLWFVGISIPGFACVLLLRRSRIPSTGMTLSGLLESLAARAGAAAQSVTRIPRANVPLGLSYGIAGVLLLVAMEFAPETTDHGSPSVFLRLSWQINLIGFFLIVRARRYFQVSADSLLAVDKRAPILFLRSFADDERQDIGTSQRALLDYSLETRLANHFFHFGPFIAIGSPKEAVPQPGAARVLLGDDEWQTRVLGWMRDANLIIMYSGKTHWVNWELRRVVESGRATRLILMFPEIKTWRSSLRKQDISARVEHVREVFRDTPWSEELRAFDDFEGLRAMLFRADGSMVMVKSRSRSRDAYHLAALIAHQQLLDPAGAAQSAPTHVAAPPRCRTKLIVAALAAAAALLGGVHLLAPGHGERLTFKKGELYYHGPVTEAQAKRVGEYLVQAECFSDDHRGTVHLVRQQDIYKMRFAINPARGDDPLTAIRFGKLGSDVSQAALAGAPLEVSLCDAYLKPIKILPQTRRLTFRKGELYFNAPVTEQEAQEVGKLLVEQKYFTNERGVTVHLSRDGDANQLRFIVKPSSVSDPAVLAAFMTVSGAIAEKALGGQPVMVHLCDAEFRPIKSERVEPRADAVGAKTVGDRTTESPGEASPTGQVAYGWLSQLRATSADLAGRSCWELSVMRNEIFAAHGFHFRYNKQIRDHFQRQPWYRDEGKTAEQVTRELNPYERDNRDLIVQAERRLGCR